ncbi:MAG: hypothetical protein QME62_05735, partial [Armatimonadota bacterium]|nr:hypothetical protein [Armatimonadota bacterium]
AYIDNKECSDIDFLVEYEGFTEHKGDWKIILDNTRLKSEFALLDRDGLPGDLQTKIVTAWKKSGYDVSMFPFKRFYTNAGQHVIVQEFKRRPFSDHIRPCGWIYAMGQKDA